MGILAALSMSHPIASLVVEHIATLIFSGIISVLNYPLLSYMVRRSFDMHVMLLSVVIDRSCSTALKWKLLDDTTTRTHQILGCLNMFLLLSLFQCLDGSRIRNWVKQMIGIILCLMLIWSMIANLYSLSYWPEIDDIEIIIPMIHKPLSIRSTLLIARFNAVVFLIKKIIFFTRHKGCVLISVHPKTIWRKENIQQAILSGLQRQRTSTRSLDIYKQAMTHKVDIYLLESNNILHSIFAETRAGRIQKV